MVPVNVSIGSKANQQQGGPEISNSLLAGKKSMEERGTKSEKEQKGQLLKATRRSSCPRES